MSRFIKKGDFQEAILNAEDEMNEIETVVWIQTYIDKHAMDSDFSLEAVCRAAGYSRRQLDRLFQKTLKTTLHEYIQAVVLSRSAQQLLTKDCSVMDVALESHYQTHEGFTRSFIQRFSISPHAYRKNQIAIPVFVSHPANHYQILKEGKTMNNAAICTVTPVKREKRKLIYLPSKSATDYFSYCEEAGCDWEGLLNSIPEKLDQAALIELPDFLQEEGQSKIAGGVEVPADYHKPLPKNFRMALLPACTMLYFQSEPFEDPDDFGKAIDQVLQAVDHYHFERYGFRPNSNLAPAFNFGAEPETGARIAVPVESLQK